MRLNRILRRQKGFTLLETMIAMAVLSFGVLSLASFYTQGLRSSDQVQMQYIRKRSRLSKPSLLRATPNCSPSRN
jgi:prepilin-type N-terminal cleavage/methylation domain-containing protein